MASTPTVITLINITNEVATENLLDDNNSHNWHGHFVGDKPSAVEPNQVRESVHLGDSSSSAALTFKVNDDSGNTWYWLFAWGSTYDSAKDTLELKVFSEIVSVNTKFDWLEIKGKLSKDNINVPIIANGLESIVNFVLNGTTAAILTAKISLA